VGHILQNRRTFSDIFSPRGFYFQMVVNYCTCCLTKAHKQGSPEYKQLKLYQNAVARYYRELDVINLMKLNRLSKVLLQSGLSQRQLMLMKIQRTAVIESVSEDDGIISDDIGLISKISTGEPMERVFALAKINRSL